MAKTLVFYLPFRSLGAMKTLRHLVYWQLLALSPTPALAETVLTFSADAPMAKVSPRSRERSPLQLPDLEYQFRIDAVCKSGLSPASLSLAVADTRRNFNAEQIAAGALNDVRLLVPAAQIAPVVIQNFCVAEGDDVDSASAASHLTVPSALSAQASLLCLGQADHAMRYASVNLDVLLVCDSVAEAAEGAADQSAFIEL
ncbi:MAG TPA: hypothetical protein VGA68_08090 [Woeseiaceae bacterium]|jgi:hypothetical protein